MTGPSEEARSTLAVRVTCPRGIFWRRRSRISPSHRANAAGSLRFGLKNRWFTVRISTLARAPPTSPSAAPNPVMLDIMWSGLSYDAAMSLSIPKFPSDAVDREHSRHLESRNDLVLVRENIPLLVADHGAYDPHLQKRRDCLCRCEAQVARVSREDHMATVLVDSGNSELEVASRKPRYEVVREVDLGTALVFWLVNGGRIPPRDPGVDSEPPAEWPADGCGSGGDAASCSWQKERVVDQRRQPVGFIGCNHPDGHPRLEELQSSLSSYRPRSWAASRRWQVRRLRDGASHCDKR